MSIKRASIVLTTSFLCLLALYVWSLFPDSVEAVFAGILYPHILKFLTILTGWSPFSLAEFLLAAVVLAVPVYILIVVQKRKDGSGRRTALFLLLTLGSVVTWIVVLGYLFWGLHYARPPLPERLSWQDRPPTTSHLEELKRLSATVVAATNRSYREAVGNGEPGHPSVAPSPEVLNRAIEEGFQIVATRLQLPDWAGASYTSAKPLVFSPILSYLGLSGIYSPLTAEPNYNADSPDSDLPHTIAHEVAHQRGFASEDEASFAGFLACIWSSHPYVNYSGYLFAQRQLLGELRGYDAEAAARLTRQRLPGINRDLQALFDFWRQYEGPAMRASHRITDTYLRINRVPGGIDSYRRSVQLIVLYSRQPGVDY